MGGTFDEVPEGDLRIQYAARSWNGSERVSRHMHAVGSWGTGWALRSQPTSGPFLAAAARHAGKVPPVLWELHSGREHLRDDLRIVSQM